MTLAEELDLRAAADELGVHYQTAYRWVRAGRLAATMVGGQYVVRRDVLAAFDEARSAPASPTAPSAARVNRSADRVHDALVNGDEKKVREIARQLVAEGASIVDVITSVFVPALRRIGQSWHDGQLAIWTEKRGSAIVERVLGELAPNPRGRRRGTAMVAALSGDRHSLPTTMAAVALRDDNWHIHHLGSDVPADEVIRFCAEHDITVAVITVTMLDSYDLATTTADRLRSTGTHAIVGRPNSTLDDLVEQARHAASSSNR